jgi:hypothetical protein
MIYKTINLRYFTASLGLPSSFVYFLKTHVCP